MGRGYEACPLKEGAWSLQASRPGGPGTEASGGGAWGLPGPARGGRVRQVGLDPRVSRIEARGPSGRDHQGAWPGLGGVPARNSGEWPMARGVSARARGRAQGWGRGFGGYPVVLGRLAEAFGEASAAGGRAAEPARAKVAGRLWSPSSGMASAVACGALPGWVSMLAWGLALWCLCGAGPLWR